jgi:hypothetical protein
MRAIKKENEGCHDDREEEEIGYPSRIHFHL